MLKQIINVKGLEIIIFNNSDGDYISLTDMAKYKTYDSGVVISNWISKKYTIQFLGAWEQMHNSNFNLIEFNKIKNEVGTNGFIISSSMWIKNTKSIGIRSNPGRYGGTYAHKDIAFEFATWLSPEFKLFLIKEFQRLKEEENERNMLGWDIKRNLAKINYKIHTAAIKEYLIPVRLTYSQINTTYASEADVLNKALFGMTAKEWKIANPDKKGNMRDYADIYQLICLSNLESINALLIKEGIKQQQRLNKLNETAIFQMKTLVNNKNIINQLN